MKTRALLLLLALAATARAQTTPDLSLVAITADQRTLDTRVSELAKSYQTLLAQMRALGASKEDLALVGGALAELDALRQKDMQGILQNLQAAAAKPGDVAPLAAALTAQKLVAARIATLVARLQLRQQELALAERAKEIAERQAANHQRTAGLGDDTPADSSPRILAGAEQQAIREEALSLADQVQRLVADPKSMPSPDIARLARPDNLDALRAAAADADDNMKSGDIKAAYAQQALLLDRLQRLSELGHLTPPPAEAARQAADAVKSLLADQKALAASQTPDPAKQAALAARAEELHSQIDGVQAAAGSQVRQAADAMRPDANNTPPAAAQQQQAEQHLQNAADLLDKQAAQLAAAAAQATPPATAAAQAAQAEQTADFLRQAQILQKSQQQLNALADGATPPGPASLDLQQTDLIRRTASLQQQVQQAALPAAAPLGQAAVRMSEALSTANPAPTAQLADASRQIALERLAQAVALLSDATQQQQQAAALAQAQQAAQAAADKLADAQKNLQQAQQQQQQGNTQNAQQAQQQANQNLQQAQQALNQAGQQSSGQLDPQAQQAMSQSWQATQQAQQQAQQGNTQAAQAAADKAAQALAQAQSQMAQQAAQQQAAQGQGQGQQQQPGQPGQQVAQGQGQGQQNQQPGQPGQPGQGQQSPPPGATGGENNPGTDVESLLKGSGADAVAGGANTVGALSPAEREALAAARHQPVAPAYTTQVETYLDNLSEAADSR